MRVNASLHGKVARRLDFFYKTQEACHDSVFVLIADSADPKVALAAAVSDRHDPDSRMHEIEDYGQANAHEDRAGPNRPLPGFMRNFEAGEVGHLHVFAFECVGGRGILLKAFDGG